MAPGLGSSFVARRQGCSLAAQRNFHFPISKQASAPSRNSQFGALDRRLDPDFWLWDFSGNWPVEFSPEPLRLLAQSFNPGHPSELSPLNTEHSPPFRPLLQQRTHAPEEVLQVILIGHRIHFLQIIALHDPLLAKFRHE